MSQNADVSSQTDCAQLESFVLHFSEQGVPVSRSVKMFCFSSLAFCALLRPLDFPRVCWPAYISGATPVSACQPFAPTRRSVEGVALEYKILQDVGGVTKFIKSAANRSY
ncbi:unnamed protein product, partial [Ixodes persulcatus]